MNTSAQLNLNSKCRLKKYIIGKERKEDKKRGTRTDLRIGLGPKVELPAH
jgi:hypothetical protein